MDLFFVYFCWDSLYLCCLVHEKFEILHVCLEDVGNLWWILKNLVEYLKFAMFSFTGTLNSLNLLGFCQILYLALCAFLVFFHFFWHYFHWSFVKVLYISFSNSSNLLIPWRFIKFLMMGCRCFQNTLLFWVESSYWLLSWSFLGWILHQSY